MNRSNSNGANVLMGDLVTVSFGIVDASGQPIRQSRFFEPKQLMDRTSNGPESSDVYFRYTDFEVGERYGITIQLKDHRARYLCRIGVDGRSVTDAVRIPNLDEIHLSRNWQSSGDYVFNVGNQNGGTVEGWRESDQSVRRFIVTDESRSYAARELNDLSGVGTIAIAVFREREMPLTPRSLGTGYAEQVHSIVEQVEFLECSTAYEVFVVRYAPANDLKQLGVYVQEDLVATNAPNRLWPSRIQRFCKFAS